MTSQTNDSSMPDPKLMSAVMAAVQAYLDEEANAMSPQADQQGRAWKLAAWHPRLDMRFRRSLSWNGRG
ncbi:MAG: hypothetical protein IIC84_00150 [Chloroflexi bacterium]|nr:hypothetical protein [Chloroflexota bacterium]